MNQKENESLRPGLLGQWDSFVGPNATKAENILMIGVAIVAGIGSMIYMMSLNLSWLQIVIGSLMALDLFGGAIANATLTTKRWYHRAGEGLQQHMMFILPHVLHILLVAWFFRAGDWSYFIVLTIYLLLSALIVIQTSPYLKGPVAALLYIGAILFGIYLFLPTKGMEWFIPVFFFKLLPAHLVPEKVS